MREISLDRLRTLVAIADQGSFVAAAQLLHLAPPTVSLHVAELESRIGAPLLPLKEPGGVRTGMAAGARYRAPTWLLVTASREDGSPSLSLMACWTSSLGGRVAGPYG